MSFPLFDAVDSADVVNLEPEYGFEDNAKKIESTMRMQAGGLITYKYAQYPAFKIPVKYLTESNRDLVNTWWSANTQLLFTYQSSNYAVRITNKDIPIGKFSKPYDDLYEGTIELEGY